MREITAIEQGTRGLLIGEAIEITTFNQTKVLPRLPTSPSFTHHILFYRQYLFSCSKMDKTRSTWKLLTTLWEQVIPAFPILFPFLSLFFSFLPFSFSLFFSLFPFLNMFFKLQRKQESNLGKGDATQPQGPTSPSSAGQDNPTKARTATVASQQHLTLFRLLFPSLPEPEYLIGSEYTPSPPK